MKKFFMMAVAAIAALSSCSSDNDIINDNDNKNHNENNKVEAPIFTATIESEVVTRTTLVGGTKVNWSNGDKIKINGVECTTTSTEGTATFTTAGTAPEAIGGKYIAVYPSSIELNAATATVTLPAIQNYDTQTNGISNVPMAAVSTSTALNFKNVCAMLAVTIPSGTVKKIKVTADEKNLSGNFILNLTNLSFTSSTGSNSVVLDCGSGVTASNTTFYIAIPPQEYSSLQIYISSDGTTYKEAMATKKAAGLGTLARNTIYPINYEKNAVQLWEDGPYFATTNVGSNNQRYQWSSTDIATTNWGSAWRMPTYEEFTTLVTNCNATYQSNNTSFTISNKNNQAGYGSISLPAVANADGRGYNAYCWSSSPYETGNDQAYRLSLSYITENLNKTFETGYNNRTSSHFVRAVLATPAADPTTSDPNLLRGRFTVSAGADGNKGTADDKRVMFTKSNLYWNGSAFAFETKQTDFPTSWGEGENAGKHVGHFFWTKTAANSYAASYNDGTNSKNDHFFADGSDADHKLTVAGTEGLYLLSKDEWQYLFYQRTNDEALRKFNVTINGLGKCCILAPDDYDFTNYPLQKSYTAEAWAAAEAMGLVCLPPAGVFNSYNKHSSDEGYYWRSTPDGSYAGRAYMFHFYSNSPYLAIGDNYEDRSARYSIRLVK